jgi:DNA (cytosine-5)-methyltransferase 1
MMNQTLSKPETVEQLDAKAGCPALFCSPALNLYAGIGGNRHHWTGGKVTAVEYDPKIAAVYAERFPDDEVIVGDAHEYLKENYGRFEFIWSSPPCPTHSRMWGQNRTPQYPDMRLYEEILFLQRWAPGSWVVENVKPWYRPLIEPAAVVGRHAFWSNLPMWGLPDPPPTPKSFIKDATPEAIADYLGIEPVLLCVNGNHDPKQAMRNCVHPETGLAIWKIYQENAEAEASAGKPTSATE